MKNIESLHRPVGTEFVLIALALLALFAGTVYAGGWLSRTVESARSESPGVDAQESLPRRARPPVDREKVIEGETITLTSRGFEPVEVKRRGGHFALNVDNRSGLKEVTFVLARAVGHKLREVRVKEGKLNWREVVNLPPGSYRLTEAGRPEWVCRIEISPR